MLDMGEHARGQAFHRASGVAGFERRQLPSGPQAERRSARVKTYGEAGGDLRATVWPNAQDDIRIITGHIELRYLQRTIVAELRLQYPVQCGDVG